MSSKKRERTEKIVTRGRLSRWQREQRWRRITIIVGCLIVAIVLAVFGYGYYDSAIAPYHQTVLKVNDETFDTDYYIEMLRLNGIRNTEESSQQQYIAQYTLQSIERNELCRQLAPDLGITVTEEEVEEKIQSQFSPAEGTGGNSSEMQQPTMSYREYIDKLAEMGILEEFYREQVQVSLLQNKIREHIGEREVPKEMLQAHVRGIMLQDEEDLKEVQERLGSGEDFSTLAEEFSKDASSEDGGDLGWMPREIMSTQYHTKVVDAAFNLTQGEVSEPIEIETETQAEAIEESEETVGNSND
ncbi:MAG: peptidylprolyl isomerase, partial [Dehalococcoidia bacterium]